MALLALTTTLVSCSSARQTRQESGLPPMSPREAAATWTTEAQRAGLRARVSDDGQAVEVFRLGRSADRVDVLKLCGPSAAGESRIRAISLGRDRISVVFGKHCFADVSIESLGTTCTGCD